MPREGKSPKGVRFLGVDDSPFSKTDSQVLVVGVLWRNNHIEGVLSTRVERDGSDSTRKLASMLSSSRFSDQARAILVNSITVAGFNIIDIKKLSELTGLPVICVTRKKPDKQKTLNALSKVKCGERKKKLVEKAGAAHKAGSVFIQVAGITPEKAAVLLKQFKTVPEPIRIAHLIGGGIVRGESSGKA